MPGTLAPVGYYHILKSEMTSKILLFKLVVAALFLTCCKRQVKSEDKVALVAKIIDKPIAAKNGAKTIVYFYRHKEFRDDASFDSRYFTYGDYFVLFINKNDPDKIEIPRPTIRYDGAKHLKTFGTAYYYDEADLKLLEEME